MATNEKIAIIGGGRLGSTLAVALSKKYSVVVSDPNSEQLFALSKKGKNISTTLVNQEAADASSAIVILAVKPTAIVSTIDSMKSALAGKLLVSCAAGTPIKKIEGIGAPRVIRVMPNICAEVGQGMFAYALGSGATIEDEERFLMVFSQLGKCLRVEEKDLNAITAASGSGPAFFAFFAKAIYEAAKEAGLSDDVATITVAQTLLGTGELLLYSKSFDDVIKTVASPGGTTEAGLKMLESRGVTAAIKEAVKNAIEKAKELEEKS